MHTFHLAGINKNFILGTWQGNTVDTLWQQLEGEVILKLTCNFVVLKVIGALGGVDQVEIGAQRTVFREITDLFNFL